MEEEEQQQQEEQLHLCWTRSGAARGAEQLRDRLSSAGDGIRLRYVPPPPPTGPNRDRLDPVRPSELGPVKPVEPVEPPATLKKKDGELVTGLNGNVYCCCSVFFFLKVLLKLGADEFIDHIDQIFSSTCR